MGHCVPALGNKEELKKEGKQLLFKHVKQKLLTSLLLAGIPLVSLFKYPTHDESRENENVTGKMDLGIGGGSSKA